MKKDKLVYRYPVLGSSVDPAKISLTIKAAVGLVVTILVGFGLNQTDLTGLADQIVQAVELVIQLGFLVTAIYGGVRKFFK